MPQSINTDYSAFIENWSSPQGKSMVDLFLKHNENVSVHSADKWGLGLVLHQVGQLMKWNNSYSWRTDYAFLFSVYLDT